MTEQEKQHALELARLDYSRYRDGTSLTPEQFRAEAEAELSDGKLVTPIEWIAAARKVFDREPDRRAGEGARLVAEGWFQTSRRYRMIARLPEGETGIEALGKASGRPEWATLLRETNAGDQFLRVYATDERTLDRSTFTAFRRAGGGTYTKP